MFWKKKKKVVPSDPAENRIDALANRLQQAGQIDRLETELLRFDPHGLIGAEKESWYHLYGIVPFRTGNRALAFERFREGMGQCPESPILAFSLGQEYEHKRQTEKMLECFDRALFPKVPATYALAESRYAYLWNRTDKAKEYVRPIMDVYFDLKILDDNFLYMRGLPFFHQTWAYLAAFSALEKDFDELAGLTTRAKSECHELDLEDLEIELNALRSNDFALARTKLEDCIKRSRDFPNGYHKMRLAVFLAQKANADQEANKILESVELTERDFPWLDDIRLLARCELSSKWGKLEEEVSYRSKFYARQPLLFEPDHAVNFNLLNYQEKLKEDYQTRGRAE